MQHLKRLTRITTSRGFTIVEMMISMVIMCLILGVLYSAYVTTIRIFSAEMNETDSYFQLTKTMDVMTSDIRNSLMVITTGTTTITVWAADTDNDGTFDANEIVTYKWTGGCLTWYTERCIPRTR